MGAHLQICGVANDRTLVQGHLTQLVLTLAPATGAIFEDLTMSKLQETNWK